MGARSAVFRARARHNPRSPFPPSRVKNGRTRRTPSGLTLELRHTRHTPQRTARCVQRPLVRQNLKTLKWSTGQLLRSPCVTCAKYRVRRHANSGSRQGREQDSRASTLAVQTLALAVPRCQARAPASARLLRPPIASVPPHSRFLSSNASPFHVVRQTPGLSAVGKVDNSPTTMRAPKTASFRGHTPTSLHGNQAR